MKNHQILEGGVLEDEKGKVLPEICEVPTVTWMFTITAAVEKQQENKRVRTYGLHSFFSSNPIVLKSNKG